MPKESHVELWLAGAESNRNVSPGIHRITPVRLLYSARRARGHTFIGARTQLECRLFEGTHHHVADNQS
jgi:hypothetical protein